MTIVALYILFKKFIDLLANSSFKFLSRNQNNSSTWVNTKILKSTLGVATGCLFCKFVIYPHLRELRTNKNQFQENSEYLLNNFILNLEKHRIGRKVILGFLSLVLFRFSRQLYNFFIHILFIDNRFHFIVNFGKQNIIIKFER